MEKKFYDIANSPGLLLKHLCDTEREFGYGVCAAFHSERGTTKHTNHLNAFFIV